MGHVTHSWLEIGRVGFLNLKVYKACFKSANSIFLYCCQEHFYSWGDALNLVLLEIKEIGLDLQILEELLSLGLFSPISVSKCNKGVPHFLEYFNL